MDFICNTKVERTKFGDEPLFSQCKFKLKDPLRNSQESMFPAFKIMKNKIKIGSGGSFKPGCFQCLSENRRIKAETRRKKLIQKIKRIYRINIDGFNEAVTNEIIRKVEILEKEKKEKEKRNLERTLKMITRLLEEQKCKHKELKLSTNSLRNSYNTKELNKTESNSEQKIIVPKSQVEKTVAVKEESQLNEFPDKEFKSNILKKLSDLPRCSEETKPEESSELKNVCPPEPIPVEKDLECSPKQIVFKDYKKDLVYFQALKITNIGLETIHCRYLGIAVRTKSEGRFPIGVAVRDNVKLRPGLSCSTKIRFCTNDPSKELECSIVYETRRSNKPLKHSWFFVPVVCLSERAIIKVTPPKLVFPCLTWCEASSPQGNLLLKKIIKIENSGGKECSCKISKSSIKIVEDKESLKEFKGEEGEIFETTSSATAETFSLGSKEQRKEVFSSEFLGEDFAVSYYETLEFVNSLMNELIENVFVTFRFSEKYFIEIPPFSTKQIEVRFIPQYKGFHHEITYLQFEGCHNLEEVMIEMVSDIQNLPITVEPLLIDLNTCVFNSGVYAGTFKIFNESKGLYSVKLKIPASLKKHAHIYPKMASIQSLNYREFSVRIYPRITLEKDAPKYFDKNSGILEFPIFIHPANIGACKSDNIKLYLFALITNYALELSPPEINFGTVTTLETIRTELQLTNHSLAPQDFGFLNLPKGVRIEPNKGFGTILPKETITLILLYSPEVIMIKDNKSQGDYFFNVRVTSVAEFGGFREVMELETEAKESFESIWGEHNDRIYAIPEENSSIEEQSEIIADYEFEEDEKCEDNSSLEGEDFNSKFNQHEAKIRNFLKQDLDKVSENSFFDEMNNKTKENSQHGLTVCNDILENERKKPWENFSTICEDDDWERLSMFEKTKRRPNSNTVKCQAIVLQPHCQLSESAIQLPATPCSSTSLYKFRLYGSNKTINPNCKCDLSIKEENWYEDQPKFEGRFEFQYYCSQIKIEPQSGFIKSGDNIPITIIYKPDPSTQLLEKDSKLEKARKSTTKMIAEKEVPLKQTKSKQKGILSPLRNNNRKGEVINDTAQKNVNLSLHELAKQDLFSEERSLQELTNPCYTKVKIQCVIKTMLCKNRMERTEIHDLLLICPTIKPNFIYLGNSQEINFGRVFVGTKSKFFLQIQNISFERISPVMSLLNPVGPFACPAGLRKVEIDPEHILYQPLTYAPQKPNGVEKEYFEIYCGPTNIFLAVKGEAVMPQFKITPDFACCFVETKKDHFEEIKVEIENFNAIKLNLQVVTEYLKEGPETLKDKEITEATEEMKSKGEKTIEDKKKSKNTENEKKNLYMLEKISDTMIAKMKEFVDVPRDPKLNIFELVGLDDNNELQINPSLKSSFKIRFSPTSDQTINEKEYVVQYKILLERLTPLKEMLVVGIISKGK